MWTLPCLSPKTRAISQIKNFRCQNGFFETYQFEKVVNGIELEIQKLLRV